MPIVDWPSSVKVPTEEGHFTLSDGRELYRKTWKATQLKCKMVAVHGFSDHCNTYNDLFSQLAARGIEVYSFDQRGWGRSAPTHADRGVTGPTSRVLADIDEFLLSHLPSQVPVFLFGHSMGGQEVLHCAAHLPATTRAQLRGYAVFSPFCGLHPSTAPSQFTVFAGRLASKVLPTFKMHQPLNEKYLTRDQTAAKRFVVDELCHDYGTLQGLEGMLTRADDLSNGKVKVLDNVKGPGQQGIWVAHGREDFVCDCAATEKWFNEDCTMQDRTLRIWEKAYHRLNDELEPVKSEFIQEMGDWILARASG